MKLIFTGGGTAGHINPAIAVANYVKRRNPNAEILYIGSKNGMESRLVPNEGFAFEGLESRGLIRGGGFSTVKKNIKAVQCYFKSQKRAREILKQFKPDAVIGTGGYVSAPVITQAAKLGIKTMSHEQNAFPGVTTKMVSKHVNKLLLAVEDAKEHLGKNCKYIVTGNPIREDIIFYKREDARKELCMDDRICLLSFGGSLGARALNEAVADLMAWHSKDKNIYHIHATGKKGYEDFLKLLKDRGVDLKENPQITVREYIDDMPRCNAAADLVIARSGAITLSEIEASAKASILIPSPNVTENHQYHNAMVLGKRDAAIVIEEKDLTGESLVKTVNELCENRQRLTELGRNAGKMAIIDANERIYNELKDLIG